MESDEVLLVLSTFPDVETAKRIGTALVTENLAACVNILPGVESIYRWKGQLEGGAEVIAFLKTTKGRFAALQSKLCELHPYEVPELIALPVTAGLPAYLQWVVENCQPRPASSAQS